LLTEGQAFWVKRYNSCRCTPYWHHPFVINNN